MNEMHYIDKFRNNGISTQLTIDFSQAIVDVFDGEKKFHRTVGLTLLEALQKMDKKLF